MLLESERKFRHAAEKLAEEWKKENGDFTRLIEAREAALGKLSHGFSSGENDTTELYDYAREFVAAHDAVRESRKHLNDAAGEVVDSIPKGVTPDRVSEILREAGLDDELHPITPDPVPAPPLSVDGVTVEPVRHPRVLKPVPKR
jgi:hypothetical protein